MLESDAPCRAEDAALQLYRMWVPVWRAPVADAPHFDFFAVPFWVVVVASQPLRKAAVTMMMKLFKIRVPIARECRSAPRMSMAFVKADA